MKLVTVVYEIVNEEEWGKTNPLHYEHNGLKAVTVGVGDAIEARDALRELMPFRNDSMKKVETETGKMITALRDGLHGLHLARMELVGEARALRLAGRKTEREAVWSRVEEITAQIEMTTRELDDHMLRSENETQRRGDAETRWTELIPCPFCGGGAQHMCGMVAHWCFCTVCGAAGRIHDTRQEALDNWNTRTANSKPKTKQRQPVTQSEAAKLCDVTEKTIRRWEKGEGTPSRYPGRGDALTLRFWAEGNRQAANTHAPSSERASGSDGAD